MVDPLPILLTLGQRVRQARLDRGLSQRALAAQAGLSARFLVQIEAGEGNLSVARLAELCGALGCSFAHLLGGLGPVRDGEDAALEALGRLDPVARAQQLGRLALGPRPLKLALVGLRGAGKTAVGTQVAARLGCPFVELDRAVEERAGMRLADIFEYHGAERYRALAQEALEATLAQPGAAVLELGGSLVTHPQLFERLREAARVVWLRASPEEHLRRVRGQGDLRPMAGHPDPLVALRRILAAREPLYAQADATLDTEELGLEGAVSATLAALEPSPAVQVVVGALPPG